MWSYPPSFRLPQPSFRRKPESMLAGSITVAGDVRRCIPAFAGMTVVGAPKRRKQTPDCGKSQYDHTPSKETLPQTLTSKAPRACPLCPPPRPAIAPARASLQPPRRRNDAPHPARQIPNPKSRKIPDQMVTPAHCRSRNPPIIIMDIRWERKSGSATAQRKVTVTS